MSNTSIIIDDIKWWVAGNPRVAQPICIKHDIRMYGSDGTGASSFSDYKTNYLKCEECVKPIRLRRLFSAQKKYVIDKIDSQVFKKMKFINLDDQALPIAEGKSKDDKYFVTAILTESKVGQRLVVYAGEKGKKQKTQIFLEPSIKRLAFDQTDLHPSDVFLKLEATFNDGTTASIEKPKK